MKHPCLQSELILVLLFLGVIGSVPVVQTCREYSRAERIQFTDVFRQKPTARNLRQFEDTLEDKSWFQQVLRPQAQRWLFLGLRDTGAKALLGRQDWLFYRPDVRYLIEPERRDPISAQSPWMDPVRDHSRRDRQIKVILDYRDQLKARGIELLVVPVPGKPSIYPDQLTRRALDNPATLESPTRSFLNRLAAHGVMTVDLYTPFQVHRRQQTNPSAPPLYLAQDTHWTPAGAELAAQTVTARLRELGWAPPATVDYRVQTQRVQRWGDLLEMMQVPGLETEFEPETVACTQVLDSIKGPLVPSASDRPGTYKSPGLPASVLVLGDSFCRIYQYAEPQSLGRFEAEKSDQHIPPPATRKLLPGSAGFISQLALRLRAPIDSVVSDGGASTDVRRRLSTNPEILEGKKVVIWEFVERDLALGPAEWERVPLPARLDGADETVGEAP
ncbi:MAG TPA: hypothetical protein PK256_10475 [Verrucomicrobiota bacterium]|nr:hypothetical protein [Verrucomicrobiota bacterium]